MKKLKINFGDGGLQGWLVRHVEKFILVLFAGVMVWFVVSGSRLEGIKAGQAPDKLREQAEAAVSMVKADRWNDVKSQPDRQATIGVERAIENLMAKKADSSKYSFNKSINPPMVAKLEPRSDPKILEPINLKVVTLLGMFALVPDAADVDPLEQALPEEDDDPKKVGKKPPVKKPAPKKPASGSGMPGMGAMMPGMPGMAGAGDKKKGKTKGKSGEVPGMPGMGMMPGMMPGMDGGEGGMPGMPGMGMMMPGMGGASGKIGDQMIIGWRPTAGATIRIAAANVVMAVVPFEKQSEEFDDKLANSLDHDPVRDKPHYRLFVVQRADVTADPTADPATLAPEAWVRLNVSASLDQMQTWAGSPSNPKELMDPSYLMPLYGRASAESPQPDGLTQPLPPFVQRDLYDAMTHPDIPLLTTAAAATTMPASRRPKVGEGGETPEDELPGAGGVSGARGAPGMPGGGMMPGMPGGGMMPGMPGGGAGGGPRMPGMPGGAGGSPGMPGGGMMPGMPSGGAAGMPGGGMPMMPGMPGGGMPGMGTGTEALVKYKLVRFIDQQIEKGHRYRYRIKVLVDDPNFPTEGYGTQPSLAGLDNVARARVQDLETQFAKTGKARTYRESAYSAPSEPTSMPSSEWFFAGKVDPETTQVLDPVTNKRYPNFGKQYTGTALVVVQDDKKAVDVPAKTEVFRGSAVNFTADVDVIHPAMGDKRKIEKYSYQTNAVVADMRGGEDIPLVTGDHTNALKAPGEMLFVDSAGNMHVRDEVDDIENFHRYIGREQPPETKKKPADGAADFGGMMGIPGGPGGMPGIPGGVPGGVPGGPSGSKPKR